MPTPERIPLGDLKAIARRELAPDNPLRRLLLSQPASLPVAVFLARVEDWLALLKMEDRHAPKSVEQAVSEEVPP